MSNAVPTESFLQGHMIRADGVKVGVSQSYFLGHRWIENTISEYRQGKCKLASLRKKRVMFPEEHFAAALMHLYIGTFSLPEIAGMASTTPAKLAFLRTQIDFMMLVDAAKVSFARHFRENLMSNDYPPVGYALIAAEYATFEELVRNQIRVPLFKSMKQYAGSISDKDRYGLPIRLYDLRSFKKLFSFLVFEESFVWRLAEPPSHEFKTVAKEIVWDKLGEDYGELDTLVSSELVKQGVKDELKRLFGHQPWRMS